MKYIGEIILDTKRNLAELVLVRTYGTVRQEDDEDSSFYGVDYIYLWYNAYNIDGKEETIINRKPRPYSGYDDVPADDSDIFGDLIDAYHGIIRSFFKTK
jgi:hypothetical protein